MLTGKWPRRIFRFSSALKAEIAPSSWVFVEVDNRWRCVSLARVVQAFRQPLSEMAGATSTRLQLAPVAAAATSSSFSSPTSAVRASAVWPSFPRPNILASWVAATGHLVWLARACPTTTNDFSLRRSWSFVHRHFSGRQTTCHCACAPLNNNTTITISGL